MQEGHHERMQVMKAEEKDGQKDFRKNKEKGKSRIKEKGNVFKLRLNL